MGIGSASATFSAGTALAVEEGRCAFSNSVTPSATTLSPPSSTSRLPRSPVVMSTSTITTTNITLPIEIIIHMAAFLDDHTLASCLRVCHIWYQALESSLWKYSCRLDDFHVKEWERSDPEKALYKRPVVFPLPELIVKNARHVKDLFFRSKAHPDWLKYFAGEPVLSPSSSSSSSPPSPPPSTLFKGVEERVEFIRGQPASQLHSLRVSILEQSDPKAVMKVLQLNKGTLKRLTLRTGTYFSRPETAVIWNEISRKRIRILPEMNRLEELVLDACVLDLESTLVLAEVCSRLKRLSLSGVTFDHPMDVARVRMLSKVEAEGRGENVGAGTGARHGGAVLFLKLQSLVLYRSKITTHPAFVNLLSAPNLVHLRLRSGAESLTTYCDQILDHSTTVPSQPPHSRLLESLNLNQNSNDKDQEIMTTLANLPRLSKFCALGAQVGPRTSRLLLDQFWKQLTVLELRLCHSLEKDAAQRMLMSFPNLVKFSADMVEARDLIRDWKMTGPDGAYAGVGEQERLSGLPSQESQESQHSSTKASRPGVQGWICRGLQSLEIKISRQRILEDPERNNPQSCREILYAQLAALTHLRVLVLGEVETTARHVEDTSRLDFTLESGMGVLGGWKMLQVLDVRLMRVLMKKEDVDWMGEAWPQLALVYGDLNCENGTEGAKEMREYLREKWPRIRHSQGKSRALHDEDD